MIIGIAWAAKPGATLRSMNEHLAGEPALMNKNRALLLKNAAIGLPCHAAPH